LRPLIGSPSLYAHKQREPEESVNFVTCHDGFTLNDLVSYDGKHNEANGEDTAERRRQTTEAGTVEWRADGGSLRREATNSTGEELLHGDDAIWGMP